MFFLFSTGSAPSALADKFAEMKKIPRISAKKAYLLFQTKKIVLIDVHPGKNKKRASVLGAYYLDKSQLDRIKLKIPKAHPIGVY